MATYRVNLTYRNPGLDFISVSEYDDTNGQVKIHKSIDAMIKLLQDNIYILQRIKHIEGITDIDSEGINVNITLETSNQEQIQELINSNILIHNNYSNVNSSEDETDESNNDNEVSNSDNEVSNNDNEVSNSETEVMEFDDHIETNYDRQKRLFNLLDIDNNGENDENDENEDLYDQQIECTKINKLIQKINLHDLYHNSYVDANERVIDRITSEDSE